MSSRSRPTHASMAAEPGVAGRGHHDRGPLVPRGELVVEEPADELEGDVLEGQRRAVEQLEQVEVAEVDEGAHVRDARRWRRPRRPCRAKRVAVDGALDEGPHDVDGHVGVGTHLAPTPRAPGSATSRARRARRRRPGR